MTARHAPATRALGGALIVILTGCRSPEPIRIGVVISSEGIAAAQFAAREINLGGGINGRELSVRYMAAGATTGAALAIAAAESLSSDPRVIAVVGHSNSSATLSASQIYNAHKLVQIAPTSSAPLLSHAGPFTFRLVASDIHQARFIADEITAGGAKPRIAVFFVNDDYGRALEQELRAQLAQRGVPLVYEAPYGEEKAFSDTAAIARAVASSRPTQLVWIGRAPHLLQLLPALRGAVPHLAVLASDGVEDAVSEQNAGGLLTGVRYVRFLAVDDDRVKPKDLRARFLARTGQPLSVEAALTYDAVMLVAAAVKAVGPHRDAVRAYLASLGNSRPAFSGTSGDIAFDATGEPHPSYYLTEITARGARTVPFGAHR